MKASSTDDVRDMYESNADTYAEMMDQEIDLPIYAELFSQLQEQIAPLPGPLVDTACGSGHMLALFHSHYDAKRPLIGVDLSPRMVAITNERLGGKGQVLVGDMRHLPDIDTASAAAVLNFFAAHHLDKTDLQMAMAEWYRVLVKGGRLLLAAWEGSGPIDYGDSADIIALRYTKSELSQLAESASFTVTDCVVKPVDDFPMDAIYLHCRKD